MVKAIPIRLFVIMLCVTAFFFNSIGNGYVMLTLCLLPVCLKAFKLALGFNIKLSVPMVLFIVFAYISTLFAIIKDSSYKFIYTMVMMLVIKFVLEEDFGWQKFFSSVLRFVASLSVIATFLSIIIPDAMLWLAGLLFKGETFETYSQLFYTQSYAGVFGHTGINAYVISIFLAFIVTALFSERKARMNYILLALGIVALFMTKKRSFLVSNAIAAFVVFSQNHRSSISTSKKMGRMMLLVVAALLIIRFAPATQRLLEKSIMLESAGDVSNGRMVSWSMAIDIWKENPLFGIGINNMYLRYGGYTHNVYLQLLAETGVFGAVTYIAMLWIPYRRSRKDYIEVLKDDILVVGNKTIYGVSLYMQVVFIVYSFFGNPLYGINFMLPYIIFVGVLDSYHKYRENVNNENGNINVS